MAGVVGQPQYVNAAKGIILGWKLGVPGDGREAIVQLHRYLSPALREDP